MKKYCVFVLLVLPLLLNAVSIRDFLRNSGPSAGQRGTGYRLHESIEYQESFSEWIPATKYTMYYGGDTSAQPDSLYFNYYYNSEWSENPFLSRLSYNDHGQLIESVTSISIYGMEILSTKMTFAYDSQNRLVHAYTYAYSLDYNNRQAWDPMHRLHIVYGEGTEFSLYQWEISETKNEMYQRSIFDFDSQGRMTTEYYQISQDSLSWQNDGKYVTEYLPQDNSTGAVFVNYLTEFYPLEMTYFQDSPIPALLDVETDYSYNGSEYILDSKTEHLYNSSMQRIEKIDFYWTGDSWQEDWKESYDYDDMGNLTLLMQFEFNMDDWNESSKKEFYWETYTSVDDPTTPSSNLMQIKAYPQPFNSSITLEASGKTGVADRYDVYNARGQLIRTINSNGVGSVIWDAKDNHGRAVANGIYFVRATKDNQHSIKRIIRVR